jgi:hypothetical protein
MVGSAQNVIRIRLRSKLKKRERRIRMQTPQLTFKIEMFGNLIEELNNWQRIGEEEDLMDSDYVEDRFVETLAAVRDMRNILLQELEEYIYDCKNTGTPVDLSYYRIKKQLAESTFSLYRP